MAHVLIVNGHQPFAASPGRLNATLAHRARMLCEDAQCTVKEVATAQDWDIESAVADQSAADLLIFQFPLNSMGVPWSLKRYLDEVYTAGMDGRLARGDGRSRRDPTRPYGSGGLMHGRRYMLSVTANAPQTAFNDPAQSLFEGRSLDDVLAPVHINFAFFGLVPLATFAAHDVAKNPAVEADLVRFEAHFAVQVRPWLETLGASGNSAPP